ncbi:MAG TPA: FG-GAP-like repeat-containing protein [bacterium]|nr:FG-GAP-like repeat-containing protein [bacterium]
MKNVKLKVKAKSMGLIFILVVFVSTLFQPLVARAVELNVAAATLSPANTISDNLENSTTEDLPNLAAADNSPIQAHVVSGEWQNQFLANEQTINEQEVKDNLSNNLYTGAVTYKYDFNLPPGRNGLMPNLFLSYNSQNLQAKSPYGYGWDLSGILSVQHNFSDGTDSAYSDNRFVFSGGGDLLPVALTDGLHGEYVLQIDNGESLRFFYQTNESWEIIDKQGVHYFLGSAAESREGVSNGTGVWKLDKIQDKNANYVLFRYENLNGVAWLSRVTYTHRGMETPLYELRFFYSARQNYQKLYNYEFLQNFNRKLNNIQLSVGGVALRNYQFSIQENAGVLLLTSITQSGKNQTSGLWENLPATTFEYNLPVANNWQAQVLSPVAFPLDYFNGLELADINNDGYSDAVIANDIVSDTNQLTNERKTYLHNKNNGFNGDVVAYHLPAPLFVKRQNGFNFFTDYSLFDINGDSYLDVAKNNSVFLFDKNTQRWNLNSNYRWFDYWFFKDNVAVEIGAHHDFNGDGLPDYANLRNKSVYLNKWDSNQNDLLPGWTELPSALLDSEYKVQGVRLVDLNGDGLTDILRSKLYVPTNGWSRFVYLNRGNGQWVQETTDFASPLPFCRQLSLTGDCHDDKVLFIDINQDGLPDLLSSAGQFYLNNGHGWSSASAGQWNLPFSLLDGTNWAKFRFAEADGRPGVDLWKSAGAVGSLYSLTWYKNPCPHVFLLNKITNEKGARILIDYESSSRFANNAGAPFSVLKQVSVDDGLGQRVLEEYDYQGAHYHFDTIWQRWRSGFGKITKRLSGGRVEQYYFHQGNGDDYAFEQADDVSKRGKLFYWEILDNNQPLRGNLSVWQKNTGRPGQSVVLQSHDWIFYFGANYPRPGHSVLLSKEYDSQNANILSSTDWGLVTYVNPTNFQDLDSTDNRQEVFTYALDKSGDIRDSISSRRILNNNGQALLHEKFSYDGLGWGAVSQGLMTQHSLLSSNNTWIAENFLYNVYGLNTKYTDFNGNAYDYQYDLKNYYQSRVTNPLGHVKQTVYNYGCAAPSQEIDVSGVSTYYRYDGFCRPLEIKRQNGTVQEILQQWQYSDSAFPVSVTQKDYLNAQNYDESKTYFDGLGRALLRLKKQTSGLWTTVLTQYDANGFISRQSIPFDSNSGAWQVYQPTLWENFTYDPLYRLTAWSNGRESFNINYQDFGKRSLLLNNQLWGEYDFDARDNLVAVRLNSGQNYSYQYDILGRLTKLTDSNSNFRQISYDLLGQVSSIDDWHAPGDAAVGRWQYKWDANGNLLDKSLPNGSRVAYRYDRLNRLLQEDDLSTTELDYLYAYDNVGYGKGNLSSIKNTDVSIDYQYDWRGFVMKETYLLKGQAYSYQYARNYAGQPLYITYPDQSALEYTYNAQGLLSAANYKQGTTTKNIIAGRQYNRFGSVVEESLGNGTQRAFRYDNYGTMIAESVLKNNQTLWQQNYTYDQWQNLRGLSATGTLIPAYQATFNYDYAQRLVSYDFVGAGNQSLASGNYSYNNLNALTSAKNKIYQYETSSASLVNPYAPIGSGGGGVDWQAEYDAAGNVVELGPYQLTWDAHSRLRTLDYQNGQVVKKYYYRADGQRLLAERTNGSKQIWLSNYYEDTGLSTKQITYGPLQKSVVNQNETFLYQYYDKFDNLALELTESGQLSNYFIYEPDGTIISQHQNEDSGALYHRQWRDTNEENLDYRGDRYYSVAWQHYLSPDPAHLDFPLLSWGEQQQLLVNPIRLNPYIYLAHNPYQYKDESGAWLETVWDVISLGLSIKDFIKEPSVWNGVSVIMDIVSVVLPVVPAGGQAVKKTASLVGGELAKLSAKYQDEIRKTAAHLNKSAEDVWTSIKNTMGKIDQKFGKKINQYWRGGKSGDVAFNFAEHYVKHIDEFAKFGIKSMDDYLNASIKFLNKSDKLIFTDLGPFHRIIQGNDVLFFNPHNKLLVIIGTDNAGQYVESFYKVNKIKAGKLLRSILGKSIFWLWDFLNDWRLNLDQILSFSICPKPQFLL